jgi:hypothetical protein
MLTTARNPKAGLISERFPSHLAEFVVSVKTGMRRTEQYSCRWSQVHLDPPQGRTFRHPILVHAMPESSKDHWLLVARQQAFVLFIACYGRRASTKAKASPLERLLLVTYFI